ALSYESVPEHLVVIGAGYIGLELGSVWRRLGSQVTILEFLDRILPGMDAELAREAQKVLVKQGLEFRLGCKVTRAQAQDKDCIVHYEGGKPIICTRVLVAVGRKPNTEGLNLDSVSIKLDEKGRIPVDEHFATNAPGIYAIGDVIRGPMLAHKAEEEGIALAERLAGQKSRVDYDAIPAVIYTWPEVASVGKTEEELNAAAVPYRTGKFLFTANPRARTNGYTEGFVKILAESETDRV